MKGVWKMGVMGIDVGCIVFARKRSNEGNDQEQE